MIFSSNGKMCRNVQDMMMKMALRRFVTLSLIQRMVFEGCL